MILAVGGGGEADFEVELVLAEDLLEGVGGEFVHLVGDADAP